MSENQFLELKSLDDKPFFVIPYEVVAITNADCAEYEDYDLKWGFFYHKLGTIPAMKRTMLTLENGCKFIVKGDVSDVRAKIEEARAKIDQSLAAFGLT